MIFASLQYVIKAQGRTAEAHSVSVINDAICQEVADSIVVIVIFFSIKNLVKV